MKVLKSNINEWVQYINNDKVNEEILKYIRINNEYYNQKPFSLENGYGYSILVFKELKEFVEYMLRNEMFGRIVEFIDLIDEQNSWISLVYLISDDVGIIMFVKI